MVKVGRNGLERGMPLRPLAMFWRYIYCLQVHMNVRCQNAQNRPICFMKLLQEVQFWWSNRSHFSTISNSAVADRPREAAHTAALCAKNSLRRLALAKDYLPTKFQVRSFIRSEIERYQKIRKWVTEITFKRHLRLSGLTRFDRAPMISY